MPQPHPAYIQVKDALLADGRWSRPARATASGRDHDGASRPWIRRVRLHRAASRLAGHSVDSPGRPLQQAARAFTCLLSAASNSRRKACPPRVHPCTHDRTSGRAHELTVGCRHLSHSTTTRWQTRLHRRLRWSPGSTPRSSRQCPTGGRRLVDRLPPSASGWPARRAARTGSHVDRRARTAGDRRGRGLYAQWPPCRERQECLAAGKHLLIEKPLDVSEPRASSPAGRGGRGSGVRLSA